LTVARHQVAIYENFRNIEACFRGKEAADSFDAESPPLVRASMTSQGLLRQALELHQRGESAAAERICRRTLRNEPANFAARHLLGLVLAQQRRNVEALQWIEAALELRPEAPSVLANRGGVLRALGRPDEALADIDRALAISPTVAPVWNKRGNVLRDLGRFEDALASYGRALELKPDYAEAFNNRGSVARFGASGGIAAGLRPRARAEARHGRVPL
jgi:protein O-GlcNAc transferase